MPHQKTELTPRLDLDMGSRMLIRFGWGGEGASEEIPAELIGCVHYEFVILRLSPNPGLLPKLVPGSMLKARYLHEGVASEFSTSIITHTARPTLLIFVAYPSSLSKLSIREHKRVQSALPAQMITPVGSLQGFVNNMSQGGCQLILDIRGQAKARTLQAGDGVTLHITINTEGTLHSVPSMLRNVDFEQFRMIAGLSFNAGNKTFQAELETYLDLAREVLS